MRALIVGAGLVGGAAGRALAGMGYAVQSVSSRSLMAGDALLTGDNIDVCVFAHGKNVTVRPFARHFHDLLASRTGPMCAAADLPGVGSATRFVLISSTVACLPPGTLDLPDLQLRFEDAFRRRFADGSIVRLAAMRGPGWQLDEGLRWLATTRVLKRLRMSGRTEVPWADEALLGAALGEAVSGPRRLVAAYDEGFDINAFLEGVGPLALRIRLPDSVFRGLYQGLGAPPAFMTLSMREVRDSGWPRIGSVAPDLACEIPAPEAKLAAQGGRVAVAV